MQKIITWNVNSVNVRLERLLGVLARHSPDILCLQELKCVDEGFPHAEVAAAGYHAAVFGQKAYNGVAILSRQPPVEVLRGFADGVDDPAARLLTAWFPGLTVMSAYVPNGQATGTDKYYYKLNWLARLCRYLRRHHSPQDALLLLGDFNVAPADLDVHDPAQWRDKILCSGPERAAFQEVLSFGLVDAFRRLDMATEGYTWWDYRAGGWSRNQGLRIDLALATTPTADKLMRCYVDLGEREGEKPSDHAPLIVEIS
jgi:exodeoxyribonuclease-3